MVDETETTKDADLSYEGKMKTERLYSMHRLIHKISVRIQLFHQLDDKYNLLTPSNLLGQECLPLSSFRE